MLYDVKSDNQNKLLEWFLKTFHAIRIELVIELVKLHKDLKVRGDCALWCQNQNSLLEGFFKTFYVISVHSFSSFFLLLPFSSFIQFILWNELNEILSFIFFIIFCISIDEMNIFCHELHKDLKVRGAWLCSNDVKSDNQNSLLEWFLKTFYEIRIELVK